MTEQKKKSADLADYADKENLRMKPAQSGKAAKTKRTYQAETLGLPPLKMVLVHAENDRANAAAEPVTKTKRRKALSQEEAVMKIIEHLTKAQ